MTRFLRVLDAGGKITLGMVEPGKGVGRFIEGAPAEPSRPAGKQPPAGPGPSAKAPESQSKRALERFTFECSGSAVGEDEPGKEAEADDAVASLMQADAAWRSRSQAGRYRER